MHGIRSTFENERTVPMDFGCNKYSVLAICKICPKRYQHRSGGVPARIDLLMHWGFSRKLRSIVELYVLLETNLKWGYVRSQLVRCYGHVDKMRKCRRIGLGISMRWPVFFYQ